MPKTRALGQPYRSTALGCSLFVLLSSTQWSCDRGSKATRELSPTSSAKLNSEAPLDSSSRRGHDAREAPEQTNSLSANDSCLASLAEPKRRLNESALGSVNSPSGVVTTVESQASEVGRDVLEEGGNAVDAVLAAALALAVTHPSAGNIGGGGFLMVHKQTQVDAIDFRENAPARLTRAAYLEAVSRGASDGAVVGIPGTVRGFELAHRRHGRLPWARLFRPAIRLAREGYRVGERQSLVIKWAERHLAASPAGKKLFLPGGKPPRPGTRLVNPGLGDTLEKIAERGSSAFYEGEVALDIIQSLGPHGLIDAADLSRYQAQVRSPLCFDFEGFRIATMPPPSGGGVTIAQGLAMLSSFALNEAKLDPDYRLHLLVEASRRAQAERKLFVSAPERLDAAKANQARERWLSPNTWLERFPIDPKAKTPSARLHPDYERAASELEHTTHLTVIDKDGMAASLTVTLSGSFGSRIVTERTGIVLNNSVASFSTFGDNQAAPSVRTVSSMAPTFVFAKGQGFVALGSPGGDTIPSTILSLILALTVDGSSLSEAVLRPRVHQGFVPDEVSTERRYPLRESAAVALRAKGHTLVASRSTIGDANVASRLSGINLAIADPREGGLALAAKAGGGRKGGERDLKEQVP